MKHYYCYCEESGILSPASRVYKVAVGDNDRDQVKKCLVDNYAIDCGFYFRIWDDATEFDLSKRCSVKPRSGYPIGHPFQIIHLSIRDLFRHIIDGDLHCVQNSINSHRNFLRMASILSPDFSAQFLNRKSTTTAQSPTRKYLSHVLPDDMISTIYAGMVVTAIFLLIGFLEGLERSML